MNLEVSRVINLASKVSEESLMDTIRFATPYRCHDPRRADLLIQSNNAALRSPAKAALPNLRRA